MYVYNLPVILEDNKCYHHIHELKVKTVKLKYLLALPRPRHEGLVTPTKELVRFYAY